MVIISVSSFFSERLPLVVSVMIPALVLMVAGRELNFLSSVLVAPASSSLMGIW